MRRTISWSKTERRICDEPLSSRLVELTCESDLRLFGKFGLRQSEIASVIHSCAGYSTKPNVLPNSGRASTGYRCIPNIRPRICHIAAIAAYRIIATVGAFSENFSFQGVFSYPQFNKIFILLTSLFGCGRIGLGSERSLPGFSRRSRIEMSAKLCWLYRR